MLSHGFPFAKQSTLNGAGQRENQLKGEMDRAILFALADKLGLIYIKKQSVLTVALLTLLKCVTQDQ